MTEDDKEFMRFAIMPTYRHEYLGMLEDLKNAKSRIDRKEWRMFYFYLRAWICGFTKARVTRGKIRHVEVFRADGKWYAKEDYERFGIDVCHYRDGEIEFD